MKISYLKVAALVVWVAAFGIAAEASAPFQVRPVVKRVDGPADCIFNYTVPRVVGMVSSQLQARINNSILEASDFAKNFAEYKKISREYCVTDSISEMVSYDMSYKFRKVSSRFLVLFFEYTFNVGNESNLSKPLVIANIDLQTGHTVRLQDLVRSDKREKLNSLIIEKLNRDPVASGNHQFLGYKSLSEASFAIEDKGIRFYFDSCSIMECAAGAAKPLIKWTELSKIRRD